MVSSSDSGTAGSSAWRLSEAFECALLGGQSGPSSWAAGPSRAGCSVSLPGSLGRGCGRLFVFGHSRFSR
eukprot:522468-Amphidinium_carterae.1